MATAKGYAAESADSKLAPISFERREPRPDDVSIEIDYCGVCHTDIHFAQNDWGVTQFPVIPGHEIIGLSAEFVREPEGRHGDLDQRGIDFQQAGVIEPGPGSRSLTIDQEVGTRDERAKGFGLE